MLTGDTKMIHRKKLIEAALPLDAINTASAREKSIRHGHPEHPSSLVGKEAACGGQSGDFLSDGR